MSMVAQRGSRLSRVVQFALAAVVLVFLVDMIRFQDLAETLATARIPYVLLALALLAPNIALQFLKWRLVVRKVDPAVENRRILVSLFIGFSLGVATPARLGEFGGRAFSIPGARPSVLVGLTGLDKYFSFLATLTFGAAGLCVFLAMTGAAPAGVIVVIALAVTAVLALTVTALLHPDFFARRLSTRRDRWHVAERLGAMLDALRLFRTRDFLALLALSVLFYATFVGQFCALLAAFTPIDAGRALVGISAVMFAKTVIPPVTFGELGIREGAAVFFLSQLGFLKAAAFNASLVLFCINLLLPGLIGLLFFGNLSAPVKIRQ